MVDYLNDFHEKTYEKYLFRHIKHAVEVAKETYKRDLDKKRQRLKELLEAEDLAYENEFRIMVQGRLDETIRQRQDSLLKIRNEQIRQNEEFLARKKAQKLIENSDKIRTILSQSLLREAKACNLAQIEEKARQQAEKDKIEQLWLCIRDQQLATDNKRQDLENRLRKQMAEEDQNLILQQIAEKHANTKEDKSSEYFSGGTGSLFYKRQSEEEKAASQRQKNIQNQKEMLRYKELRQKLLDENYEAEKRLIETINQQVQEEIRKEKERQLIRPKTAEIFLGYCKEIKKEKEKELQAEMESIQRQQAEYECKQLTVYKKRQEDRARLQKKTHDILLGQIDYQRTKKYNDTIMQKEQNIAETELLLRDMEIVKQKENEKVLRNKKYQNELELQAIERKEREIEEKYLIQEENRKFMRDNDVEDDVAVQLIKNDDRLLRNHANWRLINCGCKNPS